MLGFGGAAGSKLCLVFCPHRDSSVGGMSGSKGGEQIIVNCDTCGDRASTGGRN